MKPEKYDGNSSFETFYCQFKNCAEYNQWNENEKRHYLRWSMTGIAASMLWGTEHMSYKQLLTRLVSIWEHRHGGEISTGTSVLQTEV